MPFLFQRLQGTTVAVTSGATVLNQLERVCEEIRTFNPAFRGLNPARLPPAVRDRARQQRPADPHRRCAAWAPRGSDHSGLRRRLPRGDPAAASHHNHNRARNASHDAQAALMTWAIATQCACSPGAAGASLCRLRPLGVLPCEVGDAAGRWLAFQRGVSAVVIVGAEPLGERVVSFRISPATSPDAPRTAPGRRRTHRDGRRTARRRMRACRAQACRR